MIPVDTGGVRAPTTAVIGVGTGMRGDDGFGAAVLAALDDLPRFGGRLRLARCDGEPARLIDLWDGFDHAIVVDAAHDPAEPPGRLLHRELSLAHWPGRFGPEEVAEPAGNGHAVGFGTAIRLAEALGRLPDRLTLYAVNGADFTLGAPLSRAVAEAVPQLAAHIRHELLEQYGTTAITTTSVPGGTGPRSRVRRDRRPWDPFVARGRLEA